MKVLVIGSGGREHALAWKLAKSDRVKQVYVAPGNGGTSVEPHVSNVAIMATDQQKLLEFVEEKQIDLTLVGPEDPLVSGLVDLFSSKKLRCFGPCQAAARLEGSKIFAKDFMRQHGIATANYRVATHLEEAWQSLDHFGVPVVIKADGLAAGKGVVVARNVPEAKEAINRFLTDATFTRSGTGIVIEECLTGEEISVTVMSDGKAIVPLAICQDHKARDDGDQGPNTGGMGCYSPTTVLSPALEARIMQEIIAPTLDGMRSAGTPYKGFLYFGLMITPSGDPVVLEYNCRLGDPEAQCILMRWQSDLAEYCAASFEKGGVANMIPRWRNETALGVVVAAKGYPATASRGETLPQLPPVPDTAKIFQAGTRQDETGLVTNGGRILCVTALGKDIITAQQMAYSLIDKWQWSGGFYRRDIGYREIARMRCDHQTIAHQTSC